MALSPLPLNRDRLTDLLTDALDFPLISVEAGSGYGKTYVIDRYFQLSDKDFSWMKMTSLDNIPEHFWKKYIQCISQKNKAITFPLLQLGFPYTPSEMERVLGILDSDIRTREHSYLILDDFHLITDPDVLSFVHTLTNTGWENFSVIILSAPEPVMDLSSYREKNMVSTITEADLVFTRDEISSYMEFYSLHLSTDELEQIYQFTEGWALAVNLIVTALRNGTSFDRYKSDLMTTVFELMDKEVFSSYPLEIQKALLPGSFLSYYPLELIAALTKRPAERIIAFTRSNTFLRYDAENQTLSIHHLYLEFLKTKQYLITDEECHAILNQAGDWFLEHDYTLDALECYHTCRAYEKGLEIIKAAGVQSLPHKTAVHYLQTLDRINLDSSHPELPLYRIHLLINNMELSQADNLIRETLDTYQKQSDRNVYDPLTGELCLLAGLVHYHSKSPGFADYFEKAEALLPDGSMLFQADYPILGINRAFACSSLRHKDIEEMATAYKKGIPVFVRLTHGCGEGLLPLAMSELEFYRTHLDAAESLACQAIFDARRSDQTIIMANGYFLLIRICFAKGDYESVLTNLQEMEDFYQNHPLSSVPYAFFDIGFAWFYQKVADLDKIAPWITADTPDEHALSPMSAGAHHVIRGSWLIKSEHSPAYVLDYLNKVEQLFLKEHCSFLLIQLYMLRGFAYLTDQNYQGFVADFERMYDLIADDHLDMCFIEVGEAAFQALHILKSIPGHRIPSDWMERMEIEAMKYARNVRILEDHYYQRDLLATAASLTLQEQQFLTAQQYQADDQAIAAELNITLSQLAGLRQRAFAKIGARNDIHAQHLYVFIIIEKLLDDLGI